jgi:hypothetical protein
MAQWGKNDAASNSVIWAPANVKQAETRANANALYGNTTANATVAGQTVGMYGVSVAEARAARAEGTGDKVSSPGWQLRREGQGGRANRVTYETLVAFSNQGDMTGDGSDDTIFEDYVLSVTTSPSEATANAAAAEVVVMSVVGASLPTGASLTYQWEVDENANGTYADVSGETSANISLDSNNAIYDQAVYRCVISATGADDVTSDGAVLTVEGRVLTEDTPPANATVNSAANDEALFVTEWSTTPANTPAITYEWEVDVAGNGTFNAIAGETTANLSLYAPDYAGYSNDTVVRCVASVNGGEPTTGANAGFTIT